MSDTRAPRTGLEIVFTEEAGHQRIQMDPAVKAMWVDALRSGHYTQARGSLRCADGMCCLGVLLDLMSPEKWKIEIGPLAWGHAEQWDGGEFPNKEFLEKVGLNFEAAQLLGLLNDGSEGTVSFDGTRTERPPMDFTTIANVIETKL